MATMAVALDRNLFLAYYSSRPIQVDRPMYTSIHVIQTGLLVL